MTAITPIHSGSVTVNGAQLYYERAGTGTPLVLLHAGIADRRMWDEQVAAFAQRYQVIRYDTRGYGNSTVGVGDATRDQDLHALLQALGIPQAILLGCSQGGTTALDFALAHPEMVIALVLVSATPSGFGFKGEMPPLLAAFLAAYQQHDLAQAAELATQIWFDGPQRRPQEMPPALRSWVRTMMHEVLTTGAVDLTGAKFAAQPAVKDLALVQAPTLVIVGDQDDPSILAASELLTTQIQGAEKSVIAGAAHMLNLEKPIAFNQIVLDFLQRREVTAQARQAPPSRSAAAQQHTP